MKSTRAILGALLAFAGVVGVDGSVAADNLALYDRVRTVRKRIRQDFIAPRRGLVLTRLGRGDPLEDATLYGGVYLGCLTKAFEITRDTETAALARQVIAGLLLNASIGEPGFLARGVEPDMKTFRGDPSVDQYTAFFYGLGLFADSPLATPPERTAIARTFRDILTRLRRDRWRITRADGRTPTTYGRLADVRPTRAERLLAMLAAGAAVTGDPLWRKELAAAAAPRLGALQHFEEFQSWVLIQSGMSIELLRHGEIQSEFLDAVRRAGAGIAAACRPQIAGFDRFRRDPRPAGRKLEDRRLALEGVRIPIEAVATILLVGTDVQARETISPLREMLAEFPVEAAWYAPPLVSLELAYWQAVRRGLIACPAAKKPDPVP